MTEKDVGSKRASEEPESSSPEEHKKQKVSNEAPVGQASSPVKSTNATSEQAEDITIHTEASTTQQPSVSTEQDVDSAAQPVHSTSTGPEEPEIEEPTDRQETVTTSTNEDTANSITNEQLVLALTSVQNVEVPTASVEDVQPERAVDAQAQPPIDESKATDTATPTVAVDDKSVESEVVAAKTSRSSLKEQLESPAPHGLVQDTKAPVTLPPSSDIDTIPTLSPTAAIPPTEPMPSIAKQPSIPSASDNASSATAAPVIPTPSNTTINTTIPATTITNSVAASNDPSSNTSSNMTPSQQQQQQQQTLSAALNSLPDISAALRRLSNATVPASVIEQLSSPRLPNIGNMNERKGSIDTLPSEILGNALAAVAAVRNNQAASPKPSQSQLQQQQPLQQQSNPSAQATATAIGNLAAITANISSLLHSGGFHRNSFSQEDTQKLAAAVAVARSNSISQQGQLPVQEQQRRKSSMALMGNAFSNMIDQAAMMLGRNKSFSSEGGKLPSASQQQQQQQSFVPPKPNHLYLPQHLQASPLNNNAAFNINRYSVPQPPQPSPIHPAKAPKPTLKVNNDQVWRSIEGIKETFLGFHSYTPQLLLPNLERNVNGVIEIRVPAKYLTYGNIKVKKRALWGTDIYTDDSDIVAMAIHSGKFEPQFTEPTLDMEDPFVLAVSGRYKESCKAAKKLALRGKKYIDHSHRLVPDYDLKITVRVLPRLQHYTGSIRHRIKSRDWKKHDGMSLFVSKVEKLKRGEAQVSGRSGLKSSKKYCLTQNEDSTASNIHRTSKEIQSSSDTTTPEPSSSSRLSRTVKGRVKKPPRVLRMFQTRPELPSK